MNDSFKKTALTWGEIHNLVQEYLDYAEVQQDKTIRVFGYASLIKNHKEEKCGSALANEEAILTGAKASYCLVAAGEGEFRGEYNQFTDDRKRRSTGVYMGLESTGDSNDLTYGRNITVELDKAKGALVKFFRRELPGLPPGISYEDLVDKNSAKKFAQLSEEQSKPKMYTMAIVETTIEKPNKSGQKKLSLTFPACPSSPLYAAGKSALEIAGMVANGVGIRRKSGESYVGGSAIDYFIYNLNTFKETGKKAPFIEDTYKALEKYLKFAHDINESIKAGNYSSSIFNEIYENSGLAKHAKDLPGIFDSGISSPFFNKEALGLLTKRDNFTTEEYHEGLKTIPYTAEVALQRLSDLYRKHFCSTEIAK